LASPESEFIRFFTANLAGQIAEDNMRVRHAGQADVFGEIVAFLRD
jgi:hypothetical protein